MSTSTATLPPDSPPAKPPGKKKKLLLIVVATALLVAVVGAGGAVWLLKSRADAEADDAGDRADGAAAEHDKKTPPTFLPLDPFTVNLAGKDGDRFAQVAVTLEVEDAHFADQLRQYMPAIRNNILMVLARKTSEDLLTPQGKELLAREIQREALRPLGIRVETPGDANAADDHPPEGKAKRKRAAPPVYPIRSVLFASFIVQ